jgi:tRNA threonylcarbamoyladenosine biosynthesis protein TsaE
MPVLPEPTVLSLPTPEATTALARRLAPGLGAGDVLLLDGPIGAGKSHFARALILARLNAVGLWEEVPSPTFTLVQTYHAGDLEIWHADLYRLTHADEALELGLAEAFTTALCLVEWPDRLGPDLPADALRLEFAYGAGQDARQLTLTGGARWAGLLAGLAQTVCDV